MTSVVLDRRQAAKLPDTTHGIFVEKVRAERDRRLGLGFNYDFGGERGVHHIGTSDRDMKGWTEVTDIARARTALGSTDPITIATDTGVCDVTPLEWEAVLLAAAGFRQPIWAASFGLQAMNPIPTDYVSDEYWGA